MREAWGVFVEENLGGGEFRTWTVSEVRTAADRAEALRLAEELARQYEPQHPHLPAGRRVYRMGEGSWLVAVDGATATYHFRVSVGENVT